MKTNVIEHYERVKKKRRTRTDKERNGIVWVATSVWHAETEMGDQKGWRTIDGYGKKHKGRTSIKGLRVCRAQQQGKHMESGGNVCPSKSGKQKEG